MFWSFEGRANQMTVYRITQELLKGLPPEAPADLVHAVEVTLYSEWAAAHRGSYTLVLSAPCTLNFAATEFPRTMAIQSNAYAARCLNLERMNRNESTASYTMPRNTLAILKTHLEPPCPNYPPTWGSVTNSHVCGPADSVLTFTLPISGCSNLLTTHQGAGGYRCTLSVKI